MSYKSERVQNKEYQQSMRMKSHKICNHSVREIQLTQQKNGQDSCTDWQTDHRREKHMAKIPHGDQGNSHREWQHILLAKTQEWGETQCWRECKGTECARIADGNKSQCSHLGEQCSLLKLDSEISVTRETHKELCPQKGLLKETWAGRVLSAMLTIEKSKQVLKTQTLKIESVNK
jgi:hypothetical protein